jgi:hypothetical protein
VLVVGHSGHAQLFDHGRRIDQALRPDRLSAPGALWAWRRIDQWRLVEPERNREPGSAEDRSGLWFSLDDQHSHDLATDGPHALVWGQTGRGKTVLLQRLLLDTARRYRPDQFSCVLIDFKGGAGALGLQGLDHLAGVLTDLEPDSLRRVHSGVVAEIARREALLADHAVADISELPAEVVCPRSIIAIDEVALLLEREPRFAELLGDIASRGRSLGLHLVVSGQRMTSQVPRSVIVNAGLRFCLGVTDPMEARDYLPGVQEATIRHLSATPVGTTLALTLGDSPYTSQVVALGPPTGTQAVAERLWSESLPDVVAPVAGELGLIEQADLQRLSPWVPDDLAHGLVVLAGDVGSGVGESMSRVVECVPTHQVPLFLPDEPAALLDSLEVLINIAQSSHPHTAAPQFVGSSPPPTAESRASGQDEQPALQVFAPRIDRVWARCSEQVQAQLAERLVAAGAALSEQPQPGRLVISSRPGCGILRPLLRTGVELIVLRIGHAEYLDQWGIDRRYFSPHAPPGRGLWRDHPVHFARPDRVGATGVDTTGVNAIGVNTTAVDRTGVEPTPEGPVTHPLLARPSLEDVLSAHSGGVCVSAEAADSTDGAGASSERLNRAGWTHSDAGGVFAGAGLEAALGGAGVILRGLSPAQMRQVVGHERAPRVSPPDSQAWWVRSHTSRLIDWGLPGR